MRWVRRLWPQRVRTRLTLIFAALFLAGGSLLLGLTYALVAASLPTQAATAGKPPMTIAQYAAMCKGSGSPTPAKPGAKQPRSSEAEKAKIKQQCNQERAYLAGSKAAAARQRERALSSLLLFSALGVAVMTVVSAGQRSA